MPPSAVCGTPSPDSSVVFAWWGDENRGGGAGEEADSCMSCETEHPTKKK
jgi:hypothetical protein